MVSRIMRDEKEIVFDNTSQYQNWHRENYSARNGILESGLEILGDGKIKVKYIDVQE